MLRALRRPSCLPAILVPGLLLALLFPGATPGQEPSSPAPASGWTALTVPGTWEDRGEGRFDDLDGFAWYRCRVKIPRRWQGGSLRLAIESIDNAHEAYFDGHLIGGAGLLPPGYRNGVDQANRYAIAPDLLTDQDTHWIALRIYDHEGRGGFKGLAPVLHAGGEALELAGRWQFRPGDDLTWVRPAPGEKLPGWGIFSRVVPSSSIRGGNRVPGPGDFPTPPVESWRKLKTADDLEVELLLAEPEIAQPVFLTFDERGRLWVVEYRQYPLPAGLRMVSRDIYWRAVYDRVPPPPPHHDPGRDRITIHEDTDGDGRFDEHVTFLDGLNICTSVALGRGGVWVMHPPYLLFYADADRDDVPDSAPEVHLAGFGLEDTHSVANSIRWGPDGWLYGAQGSTVTARITRPGFDEVPVPSMGQLIWRYHPGTRAFEIFAEGGGNTFGLELDSKGRIFSGHNGGDTRGFHYVQGSYSRKGFSKHGPLSNPHAYGFFRAMPHHPVERFTHTFVIYEGEGLPSAYRGKLFGVEPLQGRVVLSEVEPLGSTFRTRDLSRVITSDDPWFRPVDLKDGPDGALYVADWYDRNVNHYRNHEGRIDRSNGRVYRLKARGARPRSIPDLSLLASRELLELLDHSDRWRRQTALRLLADRRDESLVPVLREKLREARGQSALEALWALHLSGGFREEDTGLEALEHPDPHVRRWAVRLGGDDRIVSEPFLEALIRLGQSEPHVVVRGQLASTSKRLPVEAGLRILEPLLLRDDDLRDLHVPLLTWWALESRIDGQAPRVLALFEKPAIWKSALVRAHILERLARRLGSGGSRRELEHLARLFELSPDSTTREVLLRGMELAFEGRKLAGLPRSLLLQLERLEALPDVLALRLGRAGSRERALEDLGNPEIAIDRRVELIRVLGEIDAPGAIDPLLDLLEARETPASIVEASLGTLQRHSRPDLGREILARLSGLDAPRQEIAIGVLVSRASWARALVEAVGRGDVGADAVTGVQLRRLKALGLEDLRPVIEEHWGDRADFTTKQMEAEIARLEKVIRARVGDPYAGKKHFGELCSRCHRLFEEGEEVGPDLTSYQRSDLPGMLLHVVHPDAEIREGYETYSIVTADGLRLEGSIADRDEHVVIIRGEDGQSRVVRRESILSMQAIENSLMPRGLLDSLDDQAVRDLFAYLRSTQPLNN